MPSGNLVVAASDMSGADLVDGNPIDDIIELTSSGVLDTGFAQGGQLAVHALYGPCDCDHVAAALPNGQLAITGYVSGEAGKDSRMAVAVYNADGTLDTAFGDDGVTTLWSSGGGDSLAVASDGSVLALGQFGKGLKSTMALVALTQSGQPDPTFNGGEQIAVPLSANETPNSGEYPLDGGFDDVRMYGTWRRNRCLPQRSSCGWHAAIYRSVHRQR